MSANEGLLHRIGAWKDSLEKLELSASAQRELDRTLDDAIAARLESSPTTLLTVLLLGPTGAGKSELLNALAGDRIARSHYLRPTTTQPTIYAHESVGPTDLAEYSPTLAEIAARPNAFVTHSREELRDKVLIDAPDIDSFHTEHRALVLSLLRVVDVAVYVVSPLSYKDSIGWDTVVAQRGRRAFAFVINKWDTEGKPQSDPTATQVDEDFLNLLIQRTDYASPLLFRTSARYWAGQTAGDGKNSELAPAGDEFPAFERWLSSGLASSHVALIHERRQLALWNSLDAAVVSATPPAADWKPWLAQVNQAAQSVGLDGLRSIDPYLIARAHEIAASRKTKRPRSYGLLGGLLNILPSIKRIGRITLPPVSMPLPAQPGDSAPQPLGQVLASLAELRLSSLGWAAHQQNLLVTSLQKRWSTQLASIAPEMDHQCLSTSDAMLARRSSRLRQYSGIAGLTLLELTALALVGTAIWRIAKGYLSAHYVSLSFAASFVVLFIALLVLAHLTRVLLFPNNERRILRELQKPISNHWRELIRRLQHTVNEYVESYEAARVQGAELHTRCTASAKRIESHLDKSKSDESHAEVQRLFAE